MMRSNSPKSSKSKTYTRPSGRRRWYRFDAFDRIFFWAIVALLLIAMLSSIGCRPTPKPKGDAQIGTELIHEGPEKAKKGLDGLKGLKETAREAAKHYKEALSKSEAETKADAASGKTQRELAREKLNRAANAIGWLAGVCVVIAGVTFILSWFVQVIPRKLSFGCLAAGLCGLLLQYLLLVYGVVFTEVAIWLAVAVGGGLVILAVWPMFEAKNRKRMMNKASELIFAGHLEEAVAMEATAMPEKFPTPQSRKDRLTELRIYRPSHKKETIHGVQDSIGTRAD